MTVQLAVPPRRKSVVEHGVCFGTLIALLTAAAVGIQWLMHLA